MLSGVSSSQLLGLEADVFLSYASFVLALVTIWVLYRSRSETARERLRREAEARGLEPLGAALLESLAAYSSLRADQIVRSEEAFDRVAEEHVRDLLKKGNDPRETVRDLASLKRDLGFKDGRSQPAFLSRVILSGRAGSGAAEGLIVGTEGESLEVVLGAPFEGLRRGAILELVFKDGEKMAGLAAVVRKVDEGDSFCLVHLASPERGGFRKREHFRIDTKIPATLLFHSGQVASVPAEGSFRVLSGELVNLGGGGGRLRLGFSMKEGDRFALSFPLASHGKPFGAEAKVVWAKEEDGSFLAGFEFENVDAEAWRRLLLFLFSKQSEQVRGTRQKARPMPSPE